MTIAPPGCGFGVNECSHPYNQRMHREPNIPPPQADLESLCRRYAVQRLSLFGSVLRPDFAPDSDVDVLVEFEPGRTPGLAFFKLQDELSNMIGRRVDLNTPKSLSRHFRDQVLRDARPLYVAA